MPSWGRRIVTSFGELRRAVAAAYAPRSITYGQRPIFSTVSLRKSAHTIAHARIGVAVRGCFATTYADAIAVAATTGAVQCVPIRAIGYAHGRVKTSSGTSGAERSRRTRR